MPFIDFNKQEVNFKREDFDVVIIGAGAAGILLAVQLSGKGKKVLMIESGHLEEDENRQSLNEVEQTGKEMNTAVWGRKRAIGGTTIAWGGQSLPFSTLDFQPRSWVANSGWPIQYRDLQPYYPVANRFMHIDELDYEDDIFRLLGFKPPAFNQDQIRYHFSKWAPEPDFRKIYHRTLTDRVTLLFNAVLTRIQRNAEGRAANIVIANFEKKSAAIEIQNLIIAAGGIESNRILLNNDIGNAGWLGKCFMEHPCIEVGVVHTNDPYKLQQYFNTHVTNKRKYSIRMSLSAKYQEKYRLLNGSASIMFAYADEETDPYLEIRKFLKNKSFTQIKSVFGHGNAYAKAAKALLFNKFLYKHGAEPRMVMMLEQEPSEDSRITVGDKFDRFGNKLARINWSLTPKSWDTVIRFNDMLRSELQRLSFGTLQSHPAIKPDNPDWMSLLSDVNHHMGGTRMSDRPENGVVNTNLRVWGTDNLFVCSSSVFPTGSHSNPTLTLLALASRLVDFLTA